MRSPIVAELADISAAEGVERGTLRILDKRTKAF